MHSTVTKLYFCRLLSITSIKHAEISSVLKSNIMRTLHNNQLSSTVTETRIYTWNKKRRYR